MADNEIATGLLPQQGMNRPHDELASEVAATYLPGLASLGTHGDDLRVDAISTPSLTDDTLLSRHAIAELDIAATG
jgi:hypothetical protein